MIKSRSLLLRRKTKLLLLVSQEKWEESDSIITHLVSVFSINLERFPNGVFMSPCLSSRSIRNNVVSGSVDKFLKQQNGCVRHALLCKARTAAAGGACKNRVWDVHCNPGTWETKEAHGHGQLHSKFPVIQETQQANLICTWICTTKINECKFLQ